MVLLCISHNAFASMQPITDGLNSAARSTQQVFNQHPYLCSAIVAGTAVTVTWLMWPKAEKKPVSKQQWRAGSPDETVVHSPVNKDLLSEALESGDSLSVKDAAAGKSVSFADGHEVFGHDDQDQLDEEGILDCCQAAIKSTGDDDVAKHLEMLFITHKFLKKLQDQEEPFSLAFEAKTTKHKNGALYWSSNSGRGELMSHILRLTPREAEGFCCILNASLLTAKGVVEGVMLKPLMTKLGFEYRVKQQISSLLLLQKMQELISGVSQE